ncbi:MAG: hypothetical protein AAFO81_10605 [Pseudomonadota bacterium]
MTGNAAGSVSRRGFLRLNAALLGAASTTSCVWRGQPVDARTALQLLRAEDLLSMRVEFGNLRVEHRYLKSSQLVRESAAKPASLTFILPSQHSAEQAFANATAIPSLPAAHFAAAPTRLTFVWPRDLQRIDLRVSTLLDWDQWQFDAARSTIEVPAGIVISPNDLVRFRHARQPVTYAGRSELWHTQLSAADPAQTHPVVQIALADSSAATAFALTPSIENRRSVIGKSAQLRTLMLSPMGAWLDLYGGWDTGSMRRWEHRTTAGQDQRVVVEGAVGFLYPFGHRASVIEVTERTLSAATAGRQSRRRAAVLRRRRFIVIKQAEVRYAAGGSALQSIRLQQQVTPPLSGVGDTADDPYAQAFWIESGGAAFTFQADCEDWAGHQISMPLSAMFVADNTTLIESLPEQYAQAEATRRSSVVDGQAIVVAPFAGDAQRKPDRSEGDTTLQVLTLQHGATHNSAGEQPFVWRTAAMHARIPSLANELPPDINLGWFDYLDPDDNANNVGELFATMTSGTQPIPMSYADKTDRSGGLVTPSIDVTGISRLLGPVGDADSVQSGTETSLKDYFSDDAALLFNIGLGSIEIDFEPAWAPQFYVKVEKAKEEKASDKADDKEPAEQDPDSDPEQEPDDSDTPDADEPEKPKASKERKKPKRATVKTGLNWTFDFGELSADAGLLAIKSQRNDDGDGVCKLEINTELARTFTVIKGDEADATEPAAADDAPTGASDEGNADGAQASDGAEEKNKTSWSASATLKQFDLRLGAEDLGSLNIGFSKLGIVLGPPKPEKKDEKDKQDDKSDADSETEESDSEEEPTEDKDTEKRKLPVSVSIDYGFNGLSGTGLMAGFAEFLNLVQTLQEKFKFAVDYNNSGPPAPYPPSLPGVSDADISISRGPIKMPDINFGVFAISDVSISFGLGFYLLPRQNPDGSSVRPGSLMTFALGSADKPLTALSPPWGGIAHMATSIDFDRGMTGFQFGFGIAAGAKFDFGIGTGTCLSTLAATYTFINTSAEPESSLTVILRLDGKASIAGWIEISLRLSAIADVKADGWTFAATLDAHVKVAFFVVSVNLSFSHFVPIGDSKRALGAAGDTGAMQRSDWQQYRAAFATGNAA